MHPQDMSPAQWDRHQLMMATDPEAYEAAMKLTDARDLGLPEKKGYQLLYRSDKQVVEDNEGHTFDILNASIRILTLIHNNIKYDVNVALHELIRLNWNADKYQEHLDAL